MSVINKMLRDLDQRQLAGSPGAALPRTPLPVQASVPSTARQSPFQTAWRVGLGVVAVVALGAGGWLAWQQWLGAGAATATPVATPVAAVVAGSVPTAAPALASAPSLSHAPESKPGAAEALLPKPLVPTPDATPTAAATGVPLRPGRPGDTASSVPAATVSLRMESSLSARKQQDAVVAGSAAPTATQPGLAPAASTKASTIAPEPISPAQRQQQASVDALQQAQTLWNAGSHAAAIDLLQQSVDAAERAAKAGSAAAGNPSLLSLVRELVRMQMAQAHFAAVWDLLVRLEPVLGNQPDLWAIRGNTGQRLGRHQDSVNAYRTALQARPDEQRWLLGCAVSLAALGQSAQAADMVERARSVGPISREVQAYLQQMGVPFKDK